MVQVGRRRRQAAGDNLFEIETDKVTMEVPAIVGRRARGNQCRGRRGRAGRRGGRGDRRRGRAPPKPRPRAAKPRSAPPRHARARRRPPRRLAACAVDEPRRRKARADRADRSVPRGAHAASAISARRSSPSGIVVTPLARRLAAERGIDLVAHHRLRPARPHRRARHREGASPRAAAPRRRSRRRRAADRSRRSIATSPYEEVPLDGMRRTIARG